MHVKVYPADLGGCGFYRMTLPSEALIDQGADVELIQPDAPADQQLHAWIEDGHNGPRVVDMALPEADVVVLQRPLMARTVATIEHLQAHGIRVVVEIDDHFDAIDRRNVSWSRVQPHLRPEYNCAWLRKACAMADLVTTTTPALAAHYAPHGRVAVLPNYVPEAYTHIEADPHDGTYVGWSGSIETHPADLQECGAGVAQALDATGAEFAVIGTGKGVAKALNLRQPARASGWRPLDEYPIAMAQLDIGIVPLAPTPFNEAKSWLKGLEFAALGVPFIASPTAEYRALSELFGLGVLAAKAKQWRSKLVTMITAPGRADLAAAGRETVREQLTIERHAQRWWEAWQSTLTDTLAA